MSLPHILLGMLDQPASGYDLKNRFTNSLRHFWAAELAQIYPALRRLEQDGLLSSETKPSAKGPPRKVYSRTAEGTQKLVDWLAAGPKVGEERLSYLAQVNFLAELGEVEAVLVFLRALRDHMAAWLSQLQAVEDGWRADDPGYPDELPDKAFYSQLTLALGLRKVRANVEWAEECIARVQARQSPGGKPETGSGS